MEINNMNARARKQLVAGGALGAMLIGTVALSSAATADEATPDPKGVDVNVEIAPIEEPGVLAFSVATNATTLTENTANTRPEIREFLGTLPTVTVTDTRDVEGIPEEAAWAVTGSASDFVDSANPANVISAGHLGWTPNPVEGDETGLVSEGQEVVTVLDEPTDPGNNVGLVNEEFLVSTFSSAGVAEQGAFSLDADLFLRTGTDVEAGSYTSTLTLSLFE
ncbi:hypothetical protein V5D56_11255 [Cellulosimicrobium sp. PMB13]|uniref:hypothetical protein n=1 Tax=Cellulosimicrobium sp. PMB13 TaxID=3120158 RepID=UPI003F4B9E46